MIRQPTRQLGGREVLLREGTSDKQVWADTFTGQYHVPPDTMPTPKTVLDLGANIGLTAAHYRYMWPDADILAVEMNPDNYALLRENAPDVRSARVAVTAIQGTFTYSGQVQAEEFSLERPGDRVTIGWQMRRLFTLFPERQVDFVKMDVEGTEREIFQSGDGWAERVSHLLVEVHEQINGYTWADAIVDLTNLGFQAERFDRHPQAVWAWR